MYIRRTRAEINSSSDNTSVYKSQQKERSAFQMNFQYSSSGYKYNTSYKCCHIIMNSIFVGTSIKPKQSFTLLKSTLLDYEGKFLPSLFILRWEY